MKKDSINTIKVAFTMELHHVSISFENRNENMNRDLNQVLLGRVRLVYEVKE